MTRTKSEAKFYPLVSKNYSEEIITQIRGQIDKNNLRVGDRLPSERDFAEKLNVSRNTVRQALKSLSKLGLLEIRKGVKGGAYVRDGGSVAVLSGLTDMYSLGVISTSNLTEVRILIGVEVAKLACERRTDDELKLLSENISVAQDAADAGDREKRMEINLEFHRILAKMTKNAILVALTEAVLDIVTRYIANIGGPSSNEFVMPLRPMLLDHITQRESEGAMNAMRQHLEKLHTHYVDTQSVK